MYFPHTLSCDVNLGIYSRFHVYEVHPLSIYPCHRGDTALPCRYLINVEYAVGFQLVYGIIPHAG